MMTQLIFLISLLTVCCSCGTTDEFAPSPLDAGRILDAAALDTQMGQDAMIPTDMEPSTDAQNEDAQPGDALVDSDVADVEVDAETVPGGLCPEDTIVIPAGPFIQGEPGMEVFLEAFCMDRTEVPAGAFLDCVADGACDGYENWQFCVELRPNRPHQCNEDKLDYPANWIDWYRAEQFCRWKGGRLPTPFQWEKAARGPDGRLFPWGDDISCSDAHFARGEVFDQCVGFDGLPDDILPVDSYLESDGPYGVINLAGNVKEWVDFRLDRTVLPSEAESGLTKGGGWQDSEDALLPFLGDPRIGPGVTSRDHGFRCVSDLLP